MPHKVANATNQGLIYCFGGRLEFKNNGKHVNSAN